MVPPSYQVLHITDPQLGSASRLDCFFLNPMSYLCPLGSWLWRRSALVRRWRPQYRWHAAKITSTEAILVNWCHYWDWQRMALVGKAASPLTLGRMSLELTSSNLSFPSEVEREYSRINDGIIELPWNWKISPEFKHNLLILWAQRLNPQELNMLHEATQLVSTGGLTLFP